VSKGGDQDGGRYAPVSVAFRKWFACRQRWGGTLESIAEVYF